MATRLWDALDTEAGTLAVHVAGNSQLPAATPTGAGPASSTSAPASAALLVHDFPVEADSALRTGRSLPVLADQLAAQPGWRVVAGCLRGVGTSSGDFSMCGWLEDLRALVDLAVSLAAGGGVWVVGFGVGGALALCEAADDDRVSGVACLGSPATFADWAVDPQSMLSAARRVGVVSDQSFPPSLAAWAAEFNELRPAEAAAAMANRAVLVIHGADDDEVPVADARLLADAVGRSAEIFVLNGAGHRLRADPRAIALMAGWLERQRR